MSLRRRAACATAIACLTVATSLTGFAPAHADELEPLPEQPVVAEAAPVLRIEGLETVALGAQPEEFTATVDNLAEGDAASAVFTLGDTPAELVVLDWRREDGTWQSVPLTSRYDRELDTFDAVSDPVALPDAETELRIGIPMNVSFEELSEELEGVDPEAVQLNSVDRLRRLAGADRAPAADGSSSLQALAAEAPELVILDFTSTLTVITQGGDEEQVDDPVVTHLSIVTPSVALGRPLPATLAAGDTLPFSVTVANDTASAYVPDTVPVVGREPYDATLSTVILASYFTEEQIEERLSSEDFDSFFPPLDPAEVTVTCAAEGGEAKPPTPAVSELLGFFVPPLLVGEAALEPGGQITFDCELTLADDISDGLLTLSPAALVGDFGYPVAGFLEDEESGEPIVVEGAVPSLPGDTQTPPPAARPVPSVGSPQLADTGASGGLAAGGLGLLLAGAALVAASRRRRIS